MSAWGPGPFENDAALDWVYDLKDEARWGTVDRALRATFERAAYPDGTDPEASLAAAAVVALAGCTTGVQIGEIPDPVAEFLDRQRAALPDGMRTSASAVVERVLAPDGDLSRRWHGADRERWLSAGATLLTMMRDDDGGDGPATRRNDHLKS